MTHPEPVARRLFELTEPISLVNFFSPEPNDAMAELGFRGYWDGYYAPPMVYSYYEVALVIDVVRPRPEKRLLWRGVARWDADVDDSPKEREARVREAVEEALSKFPPGASRPLLVANILSKSRN